MRVQPNGQADVYRTPCWQGTAIAVLPSCTRIILSGPRSTSQCVDGYYCWVQIDFPIEGWIINYQCQAMVRASITCR